MTPAIEKLGGDLAVARLRRKKSLKTWALGQGLDYGFALVFHGWGSALP